MTDRRDYELELRRVVDRIASSVLEATDEEIEEELRAEGEDPAASAEELRAQLLGLVDSEREKRFAAARERHRRKQEAAEVGEVELPGTPEARMELLVAVVAAVARRRTPLTLQHRDLDGMSDADVTRLLRQLAKLGALDAVALEGLSDEGDGD